MTDSDGFLTGQDYLNIAVEAEQLGQEMSQACLRVELSQLLSAVDFMPILLDRRYTVGEVLRTSAAQWLALTYEEDIDKSAAKLGSFARVNVLLTEKLASATSSAQSALVNRLTPQFLTNFCNESGYIDWPKLVEFNSGNLKT